MFQDTQKSDCQTRCTHTVHERRWTRWQSITGKSSGTVSVGGADTPYSVTREVDYQQNDTDVCVYYTANEGYEYQKGNYKVLIYESGNQIGSSTFVLK
jgi:hypothetical protein